MKNIEIAGDLSKFGTGIERVKEILMTGEYDSFERVYTPLEWLVGSLERSVSSLTLRGFYSENKDGFERIMVAYGKVRGVLNEEAVKERVSAFEWLRGVSDLERMRVATASAYLWRKDSEGKRELVEAAGVFNLNEIERVSVVVDKVVFNRMDYSSESVFGKQEVLAAEKNRDFLDKVERDELVTGESKEKLREKYEQSVEEDIGAIRERAQRLLMADDPYEFIFDGMFEANRIRKFWILAGGEDLAEEEIDKVMEYLDEAGFMNAVESNLKMAGGKMMALAMMFGYDPETGDAGEAKEKMEKLGVDAELLAKITTESFFENSGYSLEKVDESSTDEDKGLRLIKLTESLGWMENEDYLEGLRNFLEQVKDGGYGSVILSRNKLLVAKEVWRRLGEDREMAKSLIEGVREKQNEVLGLMEDETIRGFYEEIMLPEASEMLSEWEKSLEEK